MPVLPNDEVHDLSFQNYFFITRGGSPRGKEYGIRHGESARFVILNVNSQRIYFRLVDPRSGERSLKAFISASICSGSNPANATVLCLPSPRPTRWKPALLACDRTALPFPHLAGLQRDGHKPIASSFLYQVLPRPGLFTSTAHHRRRKKRQRGVENLRLAHKRTFTRSLKSRREQNKCSWKLRRADQQILEFRSFHPRAIQPTHDRLPVMILVLRIEFCRSCFQWFPHHITLTAEGVAPMVW